MTTSSMATWTRNSMTEEEVDALHIKIAMKQEQHLIPLKEDLADWLNKTLNVQDITAQNFMDKLDNGVVVCRLARLIQQKAEECKRRGFINECLPSVRFKCWENAKSESFFARDNTENFIRWCRKFGVHEAVIFESDGLVLHTQPRTVVLCLLEIGRIASKYDIEPPGLVQLEKEIDEQEDDRSSDVSSKSRISPPPMMVRSRTESALSTRLSGGFLSPPPSEVGVHHSKSSDLTPVKPTKPHKPSELDKKVMSIARNVGKDQAQIKRISEGKYCIGGRQVFVRLLKGRHVMVRVGGGWDTLEHFLSRHEPCQVIVVNRKASLSDEYISLSCNGSPDSFLHIKAKYKSPVGTPSSDFKLKNI